MAKDEIAVEGLQEGPRGMKLGRLAEILGAECVRGGDSAVSNVATLASAGPEDISFIASESAAAESLKSRAGAFLTAGGFDVPGKPVLRVGDIWSGVSSLLNIFRPAPSLPEGVDPTARAGHSVELSPGVRIGPYAVIGNCVAIGRGSSIGPGSTIGDGTTIGEDCLIHAGVHIYHNVQIGNRVVLHSGAVLGADGFKIVPVKGKLLRIPQAGTVILGDDVEIGANTTVDRAFLDSTSIGAGTKIDNLVMIAHNDRIGRNCIITGQVGIAGSTTLGDGCVIGGQAGLRDNITLGNGVQVGAHSGLKDNFADGEIVFGTPAIPIKEWGRNYAASRRVPDLLKKVRNLEKRIADLEKPDA
jgi:UDP-3-O-[3-hydroxymyristoyl] glucosamine N-acyltransferase